MILRSISKHVRDQNWFAVFLDFLIVVVGLFVGLQVTEWNEERQAKARELALLIQLSEDFDEMAAEFAAILERGAGRSQRAVRAFRALETCDAARAQAGDFDIVLAGYQNQRTARIISSTYDEMVASGALASMADRELSGRIASLYGGFRTYVEFIDGVRISLPVIDRIVWQNVDLSLDDDGWPVLGDFDLEAACNNRELKNAVIEIQDLFTDWESVTSETFEQLTATAARLDDHLHRETGP